MAIQGIFYKNVARRFSTLLLACAAGAYVFDLTINGATNTYWDTESNGKISKIKSLNKLIMFSSFRCVRMHCMKNLL
uniref:Complex III subunit 9 n=1 Tax=Panagrolaimus sp. ES5 TaxID=591445 RepID=A0AC34FR87_9BILA